MDTLRWLFIEHEQQLARYGLSDVGNKGVLVFSDLNRSAPFAPVTMLPIVKDRLSINAIT